MRTKSEDLNEAPQWAAGRQGRALVLSPEAPFPPVGGGPLRTASVVEYLSRRYDVDVVVFREPHAPVPTGAAHVIELPHHARHTLARACRNLGRAMRGRPPLNDRFAGFESELSAFLSGRSYDVAVLEHFWCAPYHAQVAPHARRTVLNLHNIESELYASYAARERWPVSLAHRRFASACRTMEREWLPRFSLVLAASEEDARRAARVAPDARCAVYPNAIPPVAAPAAQEEHVLAFSGNLAYAPNITAVKFFRRRVWPLLVGGWPDLRWRILGKNPEAIRRLVAGDPRIEVFGPVKDAVEALASASVVVVPVISGSGTRLKILEAWAARRAVVSTPLGAEGLGALDGENLVIAGTAEAFAAAVSGLLASAERRDALGKAGRAHLEARFTWPAAWEALDRLL